MNDSPAVAVLGTGIMGYPMAARLLDGGFSVRVWNRTASKAAPLGDRGATVASTPAEAAAGADGVLTMLADGATVRQAMEGTDGALTALRPDCPWLQASTVSLHETEELRGLAEASGVPFLDTPVLGTKQPAEQGQLVVLASGPQQWERRCRDFFAPLSTRLLWLGSAGQGSRLKLVANTWVLALTHAAAESVALARALGLDPQLFLNAIEGGSVDSAYAHIKGAAMIREDFPTSFPTRLAVKDAGLVLDAASASVDLTGTRAMLAHLERVEELGYGAADMAAVYHAVRTATE